MKTDRYQFDFNPRQLSDLPNTPGFRFRGIDEDGNTSECVVVLDAVGCCTVHDDKGDPCFMQLRTWLPLEGER